MAETKAIWTLDDASLGGGSWKDEIFCTLHKDGAFSLRYRRVGEDGVLNPWPGKTGINAPQVFVEALSEIWDLIGFEPRPEDIDEMCREIASLNDTFSNKLRS